MLALAVLGLLLLIIAIAVLVLFVGLRRSPRWRRAPLLLQARYLPPGLRRQAVRWRLRVQSALLRARQAVQLARADDKQLAGDLASLLQRAERLAAPLDRQLQLLQAEPDLVVARTALRSAGLRVQQLETAADQIRRAATAALEGLMVGELEELKTDAERELTALQAGVQELASLGRRGGSGEESDRASLPDFPGGRG